MRQSEIYTKTRKEAPRDEVSKNAQLLIKAGFINKEMAGVYSYLPLGVRVLRKIENIIRDEMEKIGGREVLMTTLQDPEIWKKTDRWDMDDWFKTKLKNGSELGLGTTHEEEIVNMLTHHIGSYKDLPVYLYQMQNKFRNELRSKSGLMRGREFLMKDMYSFNKSEEDFKEFYEKCAEAYKNIFNGVGIGDITFFTFASGGSFSEFSHEFQTISDAGEDIIYLDRKKNLAVNKEVYNDKALKQVGLEKENLEEVKAIEVGNIFNLGTRFSEALGLTYKDEDGNENPVFMGSYGIGLGRLMGTVAEVLSDDKGLIWPESIAPFRVHLIELEEGLGEKVYKKLEKDNIEVLYDDRVDVSPGERFNDADLIGIPWRLIVSKKTDGKIECKRRGESDEEILDYEELIRKLS